MYNPELNYTIFLFCLFLFISPIRSDQLYFSAPIDDYDTGTATIPITGCHKKGTVPWDNTIHIDTINFSEDIKFSCGLNAGCFDGFASGDFYSICPISIDSSISLSIPENYPYISTFSKYWLKISNWNDLDSVPKEMLNISNKPYDFGIAEIEDGFWTDGSGKPPFYNTYLNGSTFFLINTEVKTIKCRIDSIYTRHTDTANHFDSLVIIWASDSAGNGHFITSGVVPIKSQNSAKLAPVPLVAYNKKNGMIMINYQEPFELIVTDLKGRMIKSFSYAEELKIRLSPGTYVSRISTVDRKYVTKFFVP